MNKEKFLELFKLVKTMKKNIVYIQANGIAYGSDDFYNTLSMIIFERDYFMEDVFHSISFDVKKLTAFIRSAIDFKIMEDCFEGIDSKGNKLILFYDDSIQDNMLLLYRQVNSFISNQNIIYQNDNLKQDDEFVRSISLKANDGSTLYKINNQFAMSTFITIHPINKTDKISLKLFHIDNESFLSEFTIAKKTHVIYEYIRYRYLN